VGSSRRRAAAFHVMALLLTVASAVGSPPRAEASGAVTERVSVSATGAEANDASGYDGNASVISQDGRFVTFVSSASNLVPGDTNGVADVFVRDRINGTTERISVSSGGIQADGVCVPTAISGDGRLVAFVSLASNLVPGDTNGAFDIFVRDRLTATTQRVSVSSSGRQGDADSLAAGMSADGRFVAFDSEASDLVAADTNHVADVFLRDRLSGTTERVSVSSAGVQGDAGSAANIVIPAVSEDGRYVAFESDATNLVADDTNRVSDVFTRDRLAGSTELVSLRSGDYPAGSASCCELSMTPDGRYVAFTTDDELGSDDSNLVADVYLRDMQRGIVERISVSGSGGQANDRSHVGSISADGRFVAFVSFASNLVPGDRNGAFDAFVRDRAAGATERVSVSSDGAGGNANSDGVAISGDGRWVAFASFASNLVPSDTNGVADLFVRPVGAPVVECGGVPATIIGTASGETIDGTPGRDVIVAFGGNDVISGGGGDDMICAGSGDDAVHGGPGDDRIHAGSGDDLVAGGAGHDGVFGSRGSDVVRGGEGPDIVQGGGGDDALDGGRGDDVCRGGSGIDGVTRCEQVSGVP
jgi:Tol biopolymer transport system component